MPRHDLKCTMCGFEDWDASYATWPNDPILCHACGAPMEIVWSFPNSRLASVHPKERSVVWKHPMTGEVRYPGRNDVEMPSRYRQAGYERHEFLHLSDLDRHGKQTGRVCEIAHYDRNGRGFV